MRYIIILLLVITGCSSQSSEPDPVIPEIGDTFNGGIVYHVDNVFVYVADTQDLSGGIRIMCYDSNNSLSNQSANGFLNTRSAYENCPESDTGVALAWTLVKNGQDDWYVPSTPMLGVLLQNADEAGLQFTDDRYWGSACNDPDLGFECPERFVYMETSTMDKAFAYRDSAYAIRAVRRDSIDNL